MFKKKKYSNYAEKKKRDMALKVGAIALGTTLCVGSIYQFVVLDLYGRKVRENTIVELTNDDSEFVEMYILTEDVLKGKTIDETNLKKVLQSTDRVPSTYIKDIRELENMSARIDLPKKTALTSDMLIDMEEQITDTVKNQDFNWIKVHTFMNAGDYVDVHYKELDGTDTIVASKKKVINLSGNTFSANITEMERAYINNATVKAAICGGDLYLSIYPDPENQNVAQVTYTLDRTIQQQIEKDPNVVNKSANTLINNNKKGVSVNTSIDEKPDFTGGVE